MFSTRSLSILKLPSKTHPHDRLNTMENKIHVYNKNVITFTHEFKFELSTKKRKLIFIKKKFICFNEKFQFDVHFERCKCIIFYNIKKMVFLNICAYIYYILYK